MNSKNYWTGCIRGGVHSVMRCLEAWKIPVSQLPAQDAETDRGEPNCKNAETAASGRTGILL